MWRRIDEDPPEHQQDCLVSDGKSWPVCAISDVFDGVAWWYPRPELVEAGYLPLWWMPLPRLPQRSDVMRNGFLALVALVILSVSADAGPFRRTVTTARSSTCVGGSCSSASSRTVTRGGGAQAHAEAMAASGSMVHAASHGNTYEGVGVGGSPAAALASCCNNGRAVLEEGTAQGRDGQWYACRRYSLR
jgi:hypothetical protein